MPIYEYRCTECGFQDEYLQKVSEPPLTRCPSCGRQTFSKLLSAAGFQLKGSGWYATDFKSSGKAPEAKVESKSEAKGGVKPERRPRRNPRRRPTRSRTRPRPSPPRPIEALAGACHRPSLRWAFLFAEGACVNI
jgi:putative FmdB family regulatory protein